MSRPPAPAADATAPRWLVPAILVLLIGLGGTLVYRFVLSPGAGASAAGTETTATAAPVDAPSVTPVSAPTSTEPAEPATPAEAPLPSSTVARVDPWGVVRRETTQGRFDRAIAAIDQVQGMSAGLLQEERLRVVENARRQTLATRRGAEDMRLTASPQYVLGTTRQAEADRDRQAGRLKTAVSGYMEARSHFLRAFTDSGKAAPPAPAPVEPSAPAPTSPAATTAQTTPPANEPRVDLSTWSNEEARAAISQFCGAYLGRDLGGLNRLWPNMGPEWRGEFKEAFDTKGELVCVFENVTLVRTSDEFNATARLLTQLPGGEQRRRGLVLSLVPARDRLVIGNIKVR